MMEYKRLTNGLIESTEKGRMIVACKYELSDCNDSCLYGGYKCRWVEKALQRLAELENKIEQGTLKEIPCKVGDTVYVIIKAENGYALLKDICDGFMIKDGEVYIGLQTYNVAANKYYFTREEAEKRLKELQNGNNT